MYSKGIENKKSEESSKEKKRNVQIRESEKTSSVGKFDVMETIWRVRMKPDSISKDDMNLLQRTIGNRATIKLLSDAKNNKDKSKEEDDKKDEVKSKKELKDSKIEARQKGNTEDETKVKINSKDEVKALETKTAEDLKSKGNEKNNNAQKTSEILEKNKQDNKNQVPSNKEKEKNISELRVQIESIGVSTKENNETENKEKETLSSKKEKTPQHVKIVEEPKNNKHEGKTQENNKPLLGSKEKETPKKNIVKIKGEDPGKILEQLSSIPPDQIYGAFVQAEEISGGALHKQMIKTQKVVPTIQSPTGVKSGVAKSKARRNIKAMIHKVSNSFKGEKSGGKAHVGSMGEFYGGRGAKSETSPEAIMAEARKHASNTPSINMNGESDPSQISSFKSESAQSVKTAQSIELSQVNTDFGESNIVPKPDNTFIKAKKSSQEVTLPSVEVDHVKYIPPEVATRMNPSLSNILKAQIEARNKEYHKGKTKFDSDVIYAKDSTQSNIEKMKEDAKKKQLGEQSQAKAEVKNLRGQWKKEVNGAVYEYNAKAHSASSEKKKEISNIKTEKESKVKVTMAEAEKEANKKYKEAKTKANDKKKESSGGVIGWVKEKAEKVVDAVKSIVKSIFDGLRKAVKFIFEKAKKAAMAIIEAGRKLIVNVIKVLGKVLKTLVKTVFAKFPNIANKICNKIDSVVNKAIKLVNQIATHLKKGVGKALDLLAKRVDKLIAGVQNLYNGIFSAIGKFLKGGFKEIFMKALEAAQIAAEIALAFATGGGSILMQIVVWLGTTLPGLLNTISSVIGFVSNIKNMNLGDLKQKFTPEKMGDVMVQGLFGELSELPQQEKDKEKVKEKEGEPSGGKESKGIRKVLHAISGIFKVIMSIYGKVASGVNKILQVINITTKPWFGPFSMAYAGVMKAIEVAKNTAECLNEGVGKIREAIGGFFKTIKGKLLEITKVINEKLGLIGNPAQLMKTLANKAVDMVLNFIITHPPSALIKAAFKAIEGATDKSIVDLVRQHIPFADKLINKIAESGPIQELLKPLQKPVNQLGEIIDKVSNSAVGMVNESEQKAMGMFGNQTKFLKDMGGASGSKNGANSGADKKSKGGNGFIGTIKSGIHSRLMSHGEQKLLQSGKTLAKGVANKAKGMILALRNFKIGSESHELWVEKHEDKNVVMMASGKGKKVHDMMQEFLGRESNKTQKNNVAEVNRYVNKIENQKITNEVSESTLVNIEKPMKEIYLVLNGESKDVDGVRDSKVPIKQNEVTTYKDFVDRSVVGDNLEGHEIWQHANLKANNLATNRLSTEASKNNPVIALDREQHKIINKAQKELDAANQLPLDNIMSNSKILRDKGILANIVDDITNKALNHMKNTLK